MLGKCSVTEVPAMQAWDPEFIAPASTLDTKHSGNVLLTPALGGVAGAGHGRQRQDCWGWMCNQTAFGSAKDPVSKNKGDWLRKDTHRCKHMHLEPRVYLHIPALTSTFTTHTYKCTHRAAQLLKLWHVGSHVNPQFHSVLAACE